MDIRKSVTAATLLSGLLIGSGYAITPAAYEHYQKAVQLETMHDYRAAEMEYRMALALDPYDSMTYLKLAYLVERDGKKDEALQLYQKALDLNPKDTNIYLSIAQLWESKIQPQKALETYQKLLAANPDYTYGYLPMARLHKEVDDKAKAAEAYKTFLKTYPDHYDAQRELAALLLTEKQYSEAANVYQNLKTNHEDKFKDDLAYGISLNNSDKTQEALEVFERINTPSVVLYEQMGISYEKLNNFPKAYESYQKAIDMAPKEKYELYLKLADLATTMDKQDKAIKALEAYLLFEPDNGKVSKSLADLYLKQKDYELAASRYAKAMQTLPATEQTFRQEALQSQGYAQQMAGNLQDAITTYENALKLKNDPQTRLNLALAYHQQGEYEKALTLYRKLLVEQPDSESLRKDVGQVLLALGQKAYKEQDYKAALEHYQDAYLLGDASEIPALLGIGNTHYAMKDTDMAYTTYQRILEKDPTNMAARLNKAQLDLDRKNYMEATENLRWIVTQNPDHLEAYKLLAQAHEGLKDYAQAVLYYQKALELEPRNLTLLMSYGNVWRQMGDLERAQKAYEMARTESPDNAILRYNLGSLYNQRDQLDHSIKEYQAATEINPGFAEPYYGMGTTYEKQKKYTQAIEVYQTFLEKAPPTSSYVPLAKQRIELLKKMQTKPETGKTSSSKS